MSLKNINKHYLEIVDFIERCKNGVEERRLCFEIPNNSISISEQCDIIQIATGNNEFGYKRRFIII